MYIAYEAKLAIPLSILYFKAKFLTDFFAHLQTYNPINNNFFIDYMNKKIGFSNYY
jgi:hypothetical protein